MKSYCKKREVAETEKKKGGGGGGGGGASRKDSRLRHRFEVVTKKEDNYGCNKFLRSRQVIQ